MVSSVEINPLLCITDKVNEVRNGLRVRLVGDIPRKYEDTIRLSDARHRAQVMREVRGVDRNLLTTNVRYHPGLIRQTGLAYFDVLHQVLQQQCVNEIESGGNRHVSRNWFPQ